MPGAPTTDELVVMALLLAGGLIMLFAGWRLLRGYGRSVMEGPLEPNHWQPAAALVCVALGVGLLYLLWRGLESVAARMGIGVLTLLVLLYAEKPEESRSRRRR